MAENPYDALQEAMRDIHAQCDGVRAHIEAPDDIKALYRRAADAGIDPGDYKTLAECIAAIKALP